MKIISNTGPIIALAKVKKLACLKEVASDVVISVAVYRELFAKIGEE
jgi:predicted nucleic acid-binding protein